MRKLKGLLVCLLALGVLTGCGNDDTSKKTVCAGVLDGLDETLTLEGEGDKLVKSTENANIPLSTFGITAEQLANDSSLLDLEFLKESLIGELLGDTEMKGVSVDLTVKDENLVLDLVIDYTKVDIDALVESGFVEAGALTTAYLSFDKSVEAYEEQGLTCKEK